MQLVSIIIPIYNAENTLVETLKSVQEQTYNFFECLLIDDGSTDNSGIIATNFCKKDTRFKYYFQENAGPSKARNTGLEMATGEYIQYLDADDVMMKDRLEHMLNISKSLAENEIPYSDALLGEDKNIYSTSALKFSISLNEAISFEIMYRYFAQTFALVSSYFLFPKKAISDINWDESLTNAEDWDYFLQVLNKGYVFTHTPKPLIIYRNSANSLSKNIADSTKSCYMVLNKWLRASNSYYLLKRSALFFKRNLLLYFMRKTSTVVNPYAAVKFSNLTPVQFLTIACIGPLGIILFIVNVIAIVLKKMFSVNKARDERMQNM